MLKKLGLLIIPLLLLAGLGSCYIVDQRQYALVVQFGEVVKTELTPGLKFRIPFIQSVLFFDNRIQTITSFGSDSSEVVASDQKTMRIDAFTKYRIVDPLRFYRAVHDMGVLRVRMNSVIESTMREVIGSVPFAAVLGDQRSSIMSKVTEIIGAQVKDFGVEIIDSRITRVSLPEKALNAVYERMKTDRDKEAKEIRAKGAEEAQVIKAEADKEKTVLLADAAKNAAIIESEGASQAIAIVAPVYSRDQEFFQFYRFVKAYENSISGSNTSVVIGADHPFLRYFSKQEGTAASTE